MTDVKESFLVRIWVIKPSDLEYVTNALQDFLDSLGREHIAIWTQQYSKTTLYAQLAQIIDEVNP